MHIVALLAAIALAASPLTLISVSTAQSGACQSSFSAESAGIGLAATLTEQHNCAAPTEAAGPSVAQPPDGLWTIVGPTSNGIVCWDPAALDYGSCLKALPGGGIADVATGSPITLADLAEFVPVAGELIAEPAEWAAVGTPANFYVTTQVHEQQGALVGQAVTVRWIPALFTFDYGDGTIVSVTDPGHAWAPESPWLETSTSHVFTERGEHVVTVTVSFRSEVLFAGVWSSVQGTLDVPLPSVTIRVVQIDTVLVRGDCIQFPNDPGCG